MCGGGAPKAPKPQPNYQLMREAKETRALQAEQRATLKRQRFEAVFGLRSSKFGRSAVMTGGAGGGGYGAPAVTGAPRIENAA